MFRLLGILAIGNLLFGGHHRRRALRRGLLLGALLGFLSNRDFDMDRARSEARRAAEKAGRAAERAARTAREEIRKAAHEARRAAHDTRKEELERRTAEHLDRVRAEAEARRAAREARKAERADVIRALPVSGTKEAKEIEELVDGLERNTAAASMMANVPTIDFPEEDGKYYASRKYGYAE